MFFFNLQIGKEIENELIVKYFTLAPPRTMVVAQKITCVTANTNMKMCSWCNASSDNSGTFPYTN